MWLLECLYLCADVGVIGPALLVVLLGCLIGSAESFTLTANCPPGGKFSVRSGTSQIETVILADQVLELRMSGDLIHALRKRKATDAYSRLEDSAARRDWPMTSDVTPSRRPSVTPSRDVTPSRARNVTPSQQFKRAHGRATSVTPLHKLKLRYLKLRRPSTWWL